MGNETCTICESAEGKENIRKEIMEHSQTEKSLAATPNLTKQYESKKNYSVAFPSGIIYEGQWSGQLKHGYGIQKWPDGAHYEG